jgi:hypothetical protein
MLRSSLLLRVLLKAFFKKTLCAIGKNCLNQSISPLSIILASYVDAFVALTKKR